ncbi:Nn.00g010320.m01.CDS01 [Neocucurbitaria sp. VM-36]
MASPASTSSDNAPPRRKSRVSAEHTLNRVRENQRRHRARQKDHVATLEQKLAETEQLLAEARVEIAALKAEQAAANAMCQLNQLRTLETLSFNSEAPSTITSEETNLDTHAELGSNQPKGNSQMEYPEISDLSFLGDTTSRAAFIITDAPSLSPLTIDSDIQKSGPPPCCSDISSSPPPDETPNPECSTCKTRPPPDPSESTTLCAQAYVMISQQNFRNLDPETIRLWLAQGLRRAQREGEGCRVENGALLRLLDYISGM